MLFSSSHSELPSASPKENVANRADVSSVCSVTVSSVDIILLSLDTRSVSGEDTVTMKASEPHRELKLTDLNLPIELIHATSTLSTFIMIWMCTCTFALFVLAHICITRSTKHNCRRTCEYRVSAARLCTNVAGDTCASAQLHMCAFAHANVNIHLCHVRMKRKYPRPHEYSIMQVDSNSSWPVLRVLPKGLRRFVSFMIQLR